MFMSHAAYPAARGRVKLAFETMCSKAKLKKRQKIHRQPLTGSISSEWYALQLVADDDVSLILCHLSEIIRRYC
jgi:hypothetical protein